jgi:peptidoglycan hydrolase-like protein with peptidoglycan-binding domain
MKAERRFISWLGFAALSLVLLAGCSPNAQPAANRLPPATAAVARTTLVETRSLPGALGYGEPLPISAAGPGTLTWMAPAGATVARGETLFRVDERPVVALYGEIPMYRPLAEDAEGGDVRQLQENLFEMGYIVTVDGVFDADTAAAVRAWQADLGLPQTGSIEPGQVLFLPGPVRIAGHSARVGDALRGNPILSYTGTEQFVSVQLALADRDLAVEGQAVTVTVPGVGAVTGEIATVATIVRAPASGGAGPGGGSTAAEVRLEAIITLADQETAGSLDAAPVEVAFISEARPDVLTVPVAALLALAEGGYGLEIVEGETTRIVAVQTGLFAAGRVEVSGESIAEGVLVGVAR